eukprot:748187-Hanusia_phi.AAC.1
MLRFAFSLLPTWTIPVAGRCMAAGKNELDGKVWHLRGVGVEPQGVLDKVSSENRVVSEFSGYWGTFFYEINGKNTGGQKILGVQMQGAKGEGMENRGKGRGVLGLRRVGQPTVYLRFVRVEGAERGGRGASSTQKRT